MLVTSCEDSICRVWVETVLPEDGLVNMSNFDPLAAQNPRFRTHRHKHKFIQRLKHMRLYLCARFINCIWGANNSTFTDIVFNSNGI